MRTLLLGAAAGLIATVPMTAVMLRMHRRLPLHQRYPIPPHLITTRLAHRAGLLPHMDRDERSAATWASHFAYGSGAGAVYGVLAHHVPGGPVARGALYGLGVYAGSYLGWLPAARVLPSATRTPDKRNRMMIASHVVWGVAAALVFEALERRVRRGSTRPARRAQTPRGPARNVPPAPRDLNELQTATPSAPSPRPVQPHTRSTTPTGS